MTMERTIFFSFLCFAVEGEIGNHVFINEAKIWTEAQTYCRQHYTDLSYVGSQRDQDKLLNASAGQSSPLGWMGLYRNPDNITAWMWSGGVGDVTYKNWLPNQPNNAGGNQDHVAIWDNGEWNDIKIETACPFYCFNINVVKTKMSWEDALNHCRENHNDLGSVVSETERLLAQKMIQHVNITDPVWIGLRYLNDRWLWVNGDPLVYVDWSQGGDQDHQCPMFKRCGALTKKKGWENRDCQDKLNFICI